jgi:hypothetical protein
MLLLLTLMAPAVGCGARSEADSAAPSSGQARPTAVTPDETKKSKTPDIALTLRRTADGRTYAMVNDSMGARLDTLFPYGGWRIESVGIEGRDSSVLFYSCNPYEPGSTHSCGQLASIRGEDRHMQSVTDILIPFHYSTDRREGKLVFSPDLDRSYPSSWIVGAYLSYHRYSPDSTLEVPVRPVGKR